jgi:hypothetical protein
MTDPTGLPSQGKPFFHVLCDPDTDQECWRHWRRYYPPDEKHANVWKTQWWERWEDGRWMMDLGGRTVRSLPLYNAHCLKRVQNVTVILTEGEPAADALNHALRDAPYLAVATTCGAAVVPDPDVFAALRGRPVLLWRDADSPGATHFHKIAHQRLTGVVGSLRWIDDKHAGPSDDAVDFIRRHGPGALRDLLLDAKIDEPPPPSLDPQDEPHHYQRGGRARGAADGQSAGDRAQEQAQGGAAGGASADDADGRPGQPSRALLKELGVRPDPPPAEEQVSGAKIVAALEALIKRHVIVPVAGAVLIVALWALASWLIDRFDVFPYLGIKSPTKRCGKSRLLEVLLVIVRRPLPAANTSEAALFRTTTLCQPTHLMDEAQYLHARDDRSSPLHDLLAAGHRRPLAWVRRMGGKDRDKVQSFNVFSAKAIALIGDMTDILADRTIPIAMRRRKKAETVSPFFFSQAERDADDLRRAIMRWVMDHADDVQAVFEQAPSPAGLEDREAELWWPLMAVAKMTIPDRLAEVEKIAQDLAGVKDAADDAEGVRLLADLRGLFRGETFLKSKDLVANLVAMTERPWGDCNKGRAINERWLAATLRGFDIRPEQRWVEKTPVRGYVRKDFDDAWERYLDPEAPDKKTPGEPTA